MCQSNKKPYGNVEAANTAIDGPLRKRGKRLLAYKCPFCAFWHVKTVQKKSTVRRKIIKRAVKQYIKLTSGLAV